MQRSIRSKLNYTANSDLNVGESGLLSVEQDLQLGADPFQTIDSFGVDITSKSRYDCMDPLYRSKDIDLGSL